MVHCREPTGEQLHYWIICNNVVISWIHQQEQVMCFLMGLNDSFSQFCAQLLLMEPEPSINRTLSLVAQEAQQRAITSLVPPSPATLLVRNNSVGSSRSPTSTTSSGSQANKKDKPVCTHCGIIGHTTDKCYQLHGYPPGHRFYGQKSSFSNSSNSRSNSESVKSASSLSSNSLDSLASFTADQCQGLLTLLLSHLSTVQRHTDTDSHTPHVAGNVFFENGWQG
ncbi:uncharacterized protein LOC111025254 [Momordica charantia]|uniref:Uncharacterized protein LOC111025254 n=1 Tax=Momordica charantia TaxID=3673 RepID=A0A6J1DX32_MOMCH|nr:uncharacterized protein LOC111025254 [Momordica charantia]